MNTTQAPPNSAPAVAGTDLHYLVPICLVATLGGLLFGYDTGVISGALEPLTVRFGLSDFMRGWATGCVLIGCAAGVLVVGPISDRFGRKRALFIAAAMFFLSALGTALPRDIGLFVFFRFLGGVGIGIASISTPMYIAEIAPAHLRGRLVAVNQIAIVCGIAATSFINYFIAGAGSEAWLVETGWRSMFAAGILPATLFGGLLFRIPESPRWLVERGRGNEAREILTRVGGRDIAVAEVANIKEALTLETGTWAELFSGPMRRPLFVGITLAILQQITGINVFLYFGATIFQRLSASTGVDAGLLQQIVINGACVLFTVIAIATVDRWGRRPLMLLGATGMGLSLVAMGCMAQYSADPNGGILGLILLYIACFGLSVGPVTWVILAEISPTAIRGRALGLAAFFLWLADYAVTQTFPMMDAKGSWFVARFHHAFPFYVYAACCAVLVLVVLTVVPETKGRTLEEIGRDWRKTGPSQA
ncbi:MFS transporter, SP family, arabinose:H+ symporter/MFS transporter, SP family, xylose:H+ symportor [Opitutus sp. GAS368]|nr:MFS transporter, SP family, arabinose:H+ symporter/MFS transporter, SP family, xylose:H+ symportor [Opitutus sp. GAS368]